MRTRRVRARLPVGPQGTDSVAAVRHTRLRRAPSSSNCFFAAFALGVTAALPLSDATPIERFTGRRLLLQRLVGVACLGSVGSATAMGCAQLRDLLGRPGLQAEIEAYSDDPGAAEQLWRLRSSNQLAEDRLELQRQWRRLRAEPAGEEQSVRALETVVDVRRRVAQAEELTRRRRWAEVAAVLPLSSVAALEAAATVLVTSTVLDADSRAAIGWQWGACGWKRCGAQADVAQAICKLHASLGMIVPLEGLYYLDVAKRALDEIVAVGAAAGLVAPLPPSEYLPQETLEMFLVRDDDEGSGSEAQDYIADYEAELLRSAGFLSDDDESDESDELDE